MVAPEYWIGSAAQGGFSSLQLPAAGLCGAGVVVVYSDGTSTPAATVAGLSFDGSDEFSGPAGSWSSVASGGPFGEPYFTVSDVNTISGGAVSLGSGDYTVELWYRQPPAMILGDYSVIQFRGNASASPRGATGFYINSNAPYEPYILMENIDTAGYKSINGAGQETLNQWRHVAIVRQSNVVSAWDNGSLLTLSPDEDGYAEPLSYANTLFVLFGGIHIGQIRINTAAAIYSGSTITVPTAPFI